MITDNIIISLNSKYATRNNGAALSDVVFNFKGILTDDKSIKKKYVSLINAQIPVSFYIINEYNNRLTLKDVGGGGTHNIDIDYGNYSANTLITELTNKINAGYPHTVSIVISKLNGKSTFTFTDNTQFRHDQSTISNVLGFETNLSGTVINMTYPIDLLGTRNIYIKSQNFNISSYESITTNKSNIISSISIDEAFYNMVSFSSTTDNMKHELRQRILNDIDIQIVDENNNYINFNNINWTLTLCITIEREEKIKFSNDFLSIITKTQQRLQAPEPEQAPAPDEAAPEEALTKTFNDAQQEDQQAAEEAPPQLTEITMPHNLNEPTTFSGTLKQYSEALLKGSNNYVSSVIDVIKENGDNMIVKMTLKRVPIREMIIKALEATSLGQFQKNNPYDKLFHLAVILTLDNGQEYTLEKNATISLSPPQTRPDTEYLNVDYPVDFIVSLNALLEKTRLRMGRKYFLYNAKSNNCQDFLLNVFDANKIGGDDEREFIKQDTRKIFNSNPKYLKYLSKIITDMGGRFDNTKSFLYNIYNHKKDLNFLMS